MFVVGLDALTFLWGGERRPGLVTALRAATGAAGPHGHDVASGRRETSQHTCTDPAVEEGQDNAVPKSAFL